jgi:hypothetical protein
MPDFTKASPVSAAIADLKVCCERQQQQRRSGGDPTRAA